MTGRSSSQQTHGRKDDDVAKSASTPHQIHTTAPPPEVIKLSQDFHHSQLTDLPKRDFASGKNWIIFDSLIPALPTEKGKHSPFLIEPPAHQVTTGILIR
ncbi:uncharacterized protein EAF02_006492 [Botrytis sinoallii]|uniref:uncharacterized protein n=1 Tax=Botrytis sinoallii TaxID=1463999 RepID=UPI00190161DB|nr:uncharacterized protein EAF02_006492 [Botrytis sinoallii]KAF7881804.1 hypothetical protein EAF02_006492 [Botrytis sinoallii]